MFTTDPAAGEIARLYLSIAGPFFALFGFGQALYFATQGTGRMVEPFAAGLDHLAVAGGLGAIFVSVLGLSLVWLFAAVAAGFAVFGGGLAYALWRGPTWNPAPADR